MLTENGENTFPQSRCHVPLELQHCEMNVPQHRADMTDKDTMAQTAASLDTSQPTPT